MKAACTNGEFLELWEKYKSPEKIARALGLTVRSIYKRRQNLEAMLGIKLTAGLGQRNDGTARVATAASTNAVLKLQFDNANILIGSDIHIWPGERTTMQRAFLYFVKNYRPRFDCVILNGDVFDGARVSRHPTIGWESRPTVKQELDAVRDFLQEIQLSCGSAKLVWTLGNHDARFENRIANVAPELAGVKGVHLKDHFPGWATCWRCDINDDIVVRHREMGGEHADFRNVQVGGKTIVTGHDHRIGVVPYRNYTGRRYGVRTGYMGESALDPQFVDYMEARAPNWESGFAVLTTKGGKLLMPEICTTSPVEENQVQYRGNLIDV